ncbi:error-prone DNA polymerase [Granulosicoccaceae sp. 1_MG-2023]|nr:error-prone DNA polymerase [Granulosicoccaceae sp. 1_MG-2023]
MQTSFDLAPGYAELHCVSNFSFLRGASHAEELVDTAIAQGYSALAITDECSMAGVVRARAQARKHNFHLIIGSEFAIGDGFRLVALARTATAYSALCKLISQARRRAGKGRYHITRDVLSGALPDCECLLVPPHYPPQASRFDTTFDWFAAGFPDGWLAVALHLQQTDRHHLRWLQQQGERLGLGLVATGDVHMHVRERRPLQDVLTCIRHGCTLSEAGRRLFPNAERHLRSRTEIQALYPAELVANSQLIASRCHFRLDEIRYEYPAELVPEGLSAAAQLRQLTEAGIRQRWPDGESKAVRAQIEKELRLISELGYEHYFLTVHDIVRFARSRNILCQGRGSAANSAVCYCLGITGVNPDRMNMLFERFISKERDEPPDIDVDFEHERREEVIQYIYRRYGRERAALAATVIRYRRRSALRDLGKVLGMADEHIDALGKSVAWWDGQAVIREGLRESGLPEDSPLIQHLCSLLPQLIGFPRHLSQHVGGFVISRHPLHTLVPVENAAMPERTIIQWDKDDLEELGLLKVDVLALGMLTAIRKCLDLLSRRDGRPMTLADIPPGDTATYDMICKADTMGVFQIESRAQMSMLPRLRPRCFYDLVIEVAIVRPGPIQGGMVNPYLKRRQGNEPIHYPSAELERVLSRTLGVPVFQEQVMEIAMVAAGFSAGQADQLRRSMAAWRRVGSVGRFRDALLRGMQRNGYDKHFAEAVFRQIEGFGEYGFPESHAASFALLVYCSAWLKCHEPAAFLCALLNSQPLGFYAPSDLVRDARNHGIAVYPVDVNESGTDHRLVKDEHGRDAVRLGLRLVRGLSAGAMQRIEEQRKAGPFLSSEDTVRRCALNRQDQQALARSGALKTLSEDRYRAQWDLLGVEQHPDLLDGASAAEPRADLPAPCEAEDISADYAATGLTLGRHPLTLLRRNLQRRSIISAADWARLPNGHKASLAGLVRVRQRPATAKGVLFMTLEDDTGIINVILWPDITEQYRRQILGSRLIAVHGKTQRESGVTHLVAEKVDDLSWMLGELDPQSRDFH